MVFDKGFGENIKIEPMTKHHIEQVFIIGTECFSTPWSLVSIEEELCNKNSKTFVATLNAVTLGFINAHIVCGEGYINNIAVGQEYRRRGIGFMLIKSLIQYGKDNNVEFLTLEVRSSNQNAIEFYQNQGFEMVGVRKNFYDRPTESALLYTKYL